MISALRVAAVLVVAAVPAAVAGDVVVGIDRSRYEPAEVVVRPGDTVAWENREKRTSHDVVFEDGAASERLMPGDRYERRFEAPGRYPYHCNPHPHMRGVVVVEP